MYDLCCLGDINIDVIVYPIDVVLHGNEQIVDSVYMTKGGIAANCACVASSLGLGTVFLSRLPSDQIGEWLSRKMKSHGVDMRVSKSTKTAGITVALTQKSGKRTFLTYRGTNTDFRIDNVDFGSIKNSRHLHFGGLWIVEQLLGEPSERILKYAKENGVQTSIDIGWDFFGWKEKRRKMIYRILPYTDIIFLNGDELKALTNTRNKKLAIKFLFDKGVKIAVVHKGARGCDIYTKDGKIDIPAFKTKPVNTTGAGDAYAAGFIYGLLNGYSLKKAGTFASATASLCISHDPGYMPTRAEVNNLVKTYQT